MVDQKASEITDELREKTEKVLSGIMEIFPDLDRLEAIRFLRANKGVRQQHALNDLLVELELTLVHELELRDGAELNGGEGT